MGADRQPLSPDNPRHDPLHSPTRQRSVPPYPDDLSPASSESTASFLQQHLRFLLPALDNAISEWTNANTQGGQDFWNNVTIQLQNRIDHTCDQLATFLPAQPRLPDPDLAAHARLIEESWNRKPQNKVNILYPHKSNPKQKPDQGDTTQDP
ncbi:hypothetical protein BGX21_006959 [Mortierella sp. AD011]|nr:hypothetical protein BGX20_007172 [Mortierella sp. AD010]KAF9367902.1 hypothetical protein BGX21_006959 [Mortierella sp. AD011]